MNNQYAIATYFFNALTDAQEAAETYHEAWQDQVVWWKDRMKRLELEVQRLQGIVDYQSDYIGRYRAENEHQRNRIALAETLMNERAQMYCDLSEIHSKVQVKWGADVDRLNTMLECVVEITKWMHANNPSRQELEALVRRIDEDLQRNPRQ